MLLWAGAPFCKFMESRCLVAATELSGSQLAACSAPDLHHRVSTDVYLLQPSDGCWADMQVGPRQAAGGPLRAPGEGPGEVRAAG